MTQTASESEVAASQATESDAVQEKDLDTLLAEYDQEVNASAPAEAPTEQPKAETPQIDPKAMDFLQSEMARREKEAVTNDLNSAVKTVKDAMGEVPVSDRVVRGLLHDAASEDPRILKAWENKATNPQAFEKVLQGLASEFKKEFSVDQSVTADKEAILSAVRGSSSKQPQPDAPPDYQKMSDKEFFSMMSDMGIRR